jgi:hypothetical protein
MENAGSINASLPGFRMVSRSQINAYMIVARDLLQGVEALSAHNNIHPRSCALIAAHSLECALKAFLWHKGKKEEIRKPKVQHDLLVLWDLSYKEGDLCIPELPHDWVETLSLGHGPNYYSRYQEGKNKTIVNGGVTPVLVFMASSLKEIVFKVDNAINSK